MGAPFLRQLSPAARLQLLADLNYLNTEEIRIFCRRYSIPYKIAIEADDGKTRVTSEMDRKGIVLNRIRHFLETGNISAQTCFRASVVCFDPLPLKVTAGNKLYYGQKIKKNRDANDLLEKLTGGQFRDGAIARILLREFWSGGKAPTYRQFAAAWLQASQQHTRPNPEWAFLSDLANGVADSNWKKLRAAKAARVLEVLEGISAAKQTPRAE